MAGYSWPEGVTPERRDIVATIIHVIKENSPIESSDGRTSAKLMDLLEAEGIRMSGPWLTKTLTDLEVDGIFGHFIDRDVNGKRTYAIEMTKAADRPSLPADPRSRKGPRAVSVTAADPELPLNAIEEDPDDLDDEVLTVEADDPDQEVLVSGALVPEPVEQHGTDLEVVERPNTVDRILYIVSMLNEIVTDELTRPQVEFGAQLDARLTAVNAIIEENARLKKENEALRDDKRKLASALEQSNLIMRSRAARNGNGQPAPVAV